MAPQFVTVLTCSEKRWFSTNSCVSASSPFEWQLGLGTSIPWLSKMAASGQRYKGERVGGHRDKWGWMSWDVNISVPQVAQSNGWCWAACWMFGLGVAVLWGKPLLWACRSVIFTICHTTCVGLKWLKLTYVGPSFHLLPTVSKPVVHLQRCHTLKLRQLASWRRTIMRPLSYHYIT